MTGLNLPVDLSPRAEQDLEDIVLDGVAAWGQRQAADSEAALYRAFERLGTYPDMGRIRDDVGPDVRALPVKRHLILYQVEASSVRILRVIHGRRDAAAAVSGA